MFSPALLSPLRRPSTLAVTAIAVVAVLAGCEPGEAPDRRSNATAGSRPPEPEGPARISLTLRHVIHPGKQTESLRYTVLVPRTLEGRQVIREVDYSMQPGRVVNREGNTYAVYQFQQPREPISIDIRITADLLGDDLGTRTARRRPPAEDVAPLPIPALSQTLRARCLSPEQRLESGDPNLGSLARRATGTDSVELARQLMELVKTTLRYTGHGREQKGALGALAEKSGDCTEFSDLFVALCRARGIPARTCDGILALPPKPGDTVKHSWAEFHSPDLGWIRVDPLLTALGNAGFDRLPNAYLQLSNLRNDILLDSYSFDAYQYKGDPVKVETSVLLHEAARPRRR